MSKAKKSKVKKFIGPIKVTPKLRNQQSVDGKVKTDEKGGALTIDTRFGSFGIDKNKSTQSMKGYDDHTTKTKNFTYGKEFDVGKNTKVRINANKGTAKGSVGKSKTKGGEISISKTFSDGGLVKKGKPKLAMKGWK